MGHFTIILPNNQHGDVRYGTIKKKSLFLDLFKGKKWNNDVKKGYIVTIEESTNRQKEYRLMKTKEGKWTSEGVPGFRVTPDDETGASIQSAIDYYESQHTV